MQGVSALLKTAHIENPDLVGQLIELDAELPVAALAARLRENGNRPEDEQVRYENGKRKVLEWIEYEPPAEAPQIPWKEGGTYLITGGAGGLGMILARELVDSLTDVTVIVSGRSALDPDREKAIQALSPRVFYHQVDVTRRPSVEDLLTYIRTAHGSLDGVVHCAGVIESNFLLKKSPEELHRVLAPKVTGLVNLDRAVGDAPIDFFVLYGSSAGVFGSAGQAAKIRTVGLADMARRYASGALDPAGAAQSAA